MLGVHHRHKVISAKKDETANPLHQCRDIVPGTKPNSPNVGSINRKVALTF